MVPLIAGKAYPTSKSKHGSIPGAASANARPLDDWRNENRLVAGSSRRPGFAACLYYGDSPAATRRVVLHVIESIEQLLPDHPQIGTGHTRNFSFPDHPTLFQRTTIQILRIYLGARHWPDRL